jgi:ribosomal protein L37E
MGNRELAQLGIIIGHWNIGHAIKELHKCGIVSFHMETRGVSHCGLCHFTLKGILRQKKNYENSNISLCKNIIFKKSSIKTKIVQDIITL